MKQLSSFRKTIRSSRQHFPTNVKHNRVFSRVKLWKRPAEGGLDRGIIFNPFAMRLGLYISWHALSHEVFFPLQIEIQPEETQEFPRRLVGG